MFPSHHLSSELSPALSALSSGSPLPENQVLASTPPHAASSCLTPTLILSFAFFSSDAQVFPTRRLWPDLRVTLSSYNTIYVSLVKAALLNPAPQRNHSSFIARLLYFNSL